MTPESMSTREILLTLIATQERCEEMLNVALADLEALRLIIPAISPDAASLLGRALEANRDRYAEVLRQRRADFELLLVAASRTVQ
jgi:hypothetical protein